MLLNMKSLSSCDFYVHTFKPIENVEKCNNTVVQYFIFHSVLGFQELYCRCFYHPYRSGRYERYEKVSLEEALIFQVMSS
jgi:hypothetical protein